MLCSQLPPTCPLHSPRRPLDSARPLCVGVLWASATSCVLPSAYLFSIPRESLPSGFVFTPWSRPAHRTIKMAPHGSPRAIPVLYSQPPASRVWQEPPSLPKASSSALSSAYTLGPSLPKSLTVFPTPRLLSPLLSEPWEWTSIMSVCPVILSAAPSDDRTPFSLSRPPLVRSLRFDEASNRIIPFLLATVIGPGMDL